MSKVYIFLADGFEEVEALTVVDLLRRAEVDVVMVSITGEINVTGSHAIQVATDAIFEEIDFVDASLLVLPGGMPGTAHLMQHEGLDRLLKEFNKKGKSLAAICAAPSILGSKGLLNGKNATCYPGFEEKCIGAKISNKSIVVDGNIITSRGLGTAIDFSLGIITRLRGELEANKIADAIQYRN